MLTRTPLLERVAADESNWLIEAGAGYGKTVFLDHLRSTLVKDLLVVRKPFDDTSLFGFLSELAAAARRSGRRDLSQAFAGTEGDASALAVILDQQQMVLAVDDSHFWDDDVAHHIVRLSDSASQHSRIIICGRRLSSPFDSLRRSAGWNDLAMTDLAFSEDDVAMLLESMSISKSAAPLLHRLTEGWPLAVMSGASQIQNAPDTDAAAQELARRGTLVDGLLTDYLKKLDSEDTEMARSLALLPFFDGQIAAITGSSNLIDRLMTAGIAITKRADGWSELADHFKSSLLRSQASPPSFPVRAIDHLVERGEVMAAIHACLGQGEHDVAAQVIAGLTSQQQSAVEPRMLNAAMATISDAVETNPAALLVQAEVNASFGQVPQSRGFLSRAVEIVERTDPDLAHQASLRIMVASALWLIQDGNRKDSEATLDRCEPRIPDDEQSPLRGQLHDVRGMIEFTRGTREALELAVSEQTRALAIWRQLADARRAAVTVFRIASGPLLALGRYREALDVLEELPLVGPMTLINEARLSMEKAMVLPYLGRATEVPAVADEAKRLAELLGHPWLTRWATWAEVIAASFDNRCEDTYALAQVFLASQEAMDDFTLGIATSEVADALARCGFIADAGELIKQAGQLPTPGVIVRFVSASLEARDGDPERAAHAIEELRHHPDMIHGKRWYLELLDAVAARRGGDLARMNDSYSRCCALVADLGEPSLPRVMERTQVDLIEDALEHSGNTTVIREDVIEIALFDEFAVSASGRRLPTSKSLATTLVKILVLSGGRMVIDQAIDPLWPDADLELGRQRLRNVLRRAKEHYGELIVRDGEVLQLAQRVGSDYARAIELANGALAAPSSSTAIAQAIAAVDRPLLPTDRYNDWAENARLDLTTRLVKLLDLQARVAEHEGDIDLAVQSLERGHELAPHSPGRRASAASLLRAAGRTAAAETLDGG